MKEDDAKNLKERISLKYLTEDDLWLEEYFKYLVVKAKLKDEAYPCAAIEKVINTHMEITSEYREFNKLLGLNHGKNNFTYDMLNNWYVS